MAYKCDRCGVLFDRDFEPGITVCLQTHVLELWACAINAKKSLKNGLEKYSLTVNI